VTNAGAADITQLAVLLDAQERAVFGDQRRRNERRQADQARGMRYRIKRCPKSRRTVKRALADDQLGPLAD